MMGVGISTGGRGSELVSPDSVGRVCAVWSAKTRRFPSSRRGLCHAPAIGCNLSTNRKRKPKWRRCVAASIAAGPSAIPTGSQTRPSDWAWNGRFGLVEDRRNNHKACHSYLYYPDLVAVTFTYPDLVAVTFTYLPVFSRFGGCHLHLPRT